jgi:hypothetical protein
MRPVQSRHQKRVIEINRKSLIVAQNQIMQLLTLNVRKLAIAQCMYQSEKISPVRW